MHNCGRCGKPMYTPEQICEGCKKALTKKVDREQRHFEKAQDFEKKFRGPPEDEDGEDDLFWVDDKEKKKGGYDATAVWVDKDHQKKLKKRHR